MLFKMWVLSYQLDACIGSEGGTVAGWLHESCWPGFEFQLCPWSTVWHGYVTFLRFHFLICKMGLLIPNSQSCQDWNDNVYNSLLKINSLLHFNSWIKKSQLFCLPLNISLTVKIFKIQWSKQKNLETELSL